MSKVYRVGIIGVSGYGNTHYQDLLRCRAEGAVNIAAATVINQDEEREKCETLRSFGCRLYTDYRTMLAELAGKLDLVFIPTGILQHAPMAIAAMKAGANAFIEKPAAATVQEVRAMREAEESTGRFTAVGYQFIYQPETQEVKRALLAGRLGRLRRIRGLGMWPRVMNYYRRNRWSGRLWSDGWVLDSPFGNALAHHLNLICYFAGERFEDSAEPAWIEAGLFRANPEIESCDTAILRMGCADGIELEFCTTHASQERFDPEITIEGEEGSIVWRPEESVFRHGGEARTCRHDTTVMRKNVTDALLARLGDPAAFICNLDIAGAQVLANDGAYESAAILPLPGELLTLPDGNCRYVSSGLDAKLRAVYEGKSTPEAVGLPLGERFRLAHYREFAGGKLGAVK